MVEPSCPGAVERYVNLGECYDCAALAPRREEILAVMAGYRGCYRRAYRCLGASAEIFEDMRATLLTGAVREKLEKRARGILSRELRGRKGAEPGKVKQRFLGAVTCQGRMCLFGTALAQCQRVYELSDSFGLAHELLLCLLAGATAAGWDAVACPDPMAPKRLAHLLVPGAGVCFLSSTAALPLPEKPYRRLRVDAMVDRELLRRSRPRLHFSRKVSAALLEEAEVSLAQAKAMHDDLEAVYNPYVDFDRVARTALAVGDEILALRRPE